MLDSSKMNCEHPAELMMNLTLSTCLKSSAPSGHRRVVSLTNPSLSAVCFSSSVPAVLCPLQWSINSHVLPTTSDL